MERSRLINTDLIVEYMKSNNLTIDEFCKKCDISRYCYNRVFSANPNIKITTAKKILEVIHASCDKFLYIR